VNPFCGAGYKNLRPIGAPSGRGLPNLETTQLLLLSGAANPGCSRLSAGSIDGENLKVKPASEIVLERDGSAWKVDKNGMESGLHKTHALQGPIDDAFLDPFLLVRPTGGPWNDEVNQQAVRSLARFLE
jgi:hypothetical protein